MRCQICKRELSGDEPIYRVHWGYPWSSDWPRRFGAHTSTGSACERCRAEPPKDGEWFFRGPWIAVWLCCACGRPVFVDREEKALRHFVCGPECRLVVYNEQRDRRMTPRACAACGETFRPKRADSRYCSEACKRQAYRARQHLALGP